MAEGLRVEDQEGIEDRHGPDGRRETRSLNHVLIHTSV
jgi:hypothetical protein